MKKIKSNNMNKMNFSHLTTKIFLLTAFLVVGFLNTKAQSLISRYQFASSSGTYTAITGGTVWQSGATLATNAVTNVTLPFTFNFNGTNFTAINISNNGFITFGATAPSVSDYAALSTSTSYSGAIVGYGLNLVNSPVGGTTPEIRYEQVGSEFIIQFQDLGRTGITGDRMNFQIRLTQTTNTIKIVYGTWAATTTTTAAANMGQVGLRGASNTDYSGRNVNATSPYNTWSSSGGSTATLNTNTGTMRYNNAYLPASGLTYTWTLNSTYSALPYTQNFETSPWGNRNSLQDAASTTSMSTFPQLGNPAWKRQDATTTNSLWSSTSGSLSALTGAQGTGVARFHSYDATSGAKGYMDFYLDFSTAGTKQLTFDYQNTSGTDALQVALSTDGGLTFSNVGSAYGVAASWTAQTVSSLSSSTSTTVVLRFIATSDFGLNDIGVDNVNVFVPVTPTISSFSPTPNLCLNGGQTVTVSGTNFTGTSAVTFNGVNATSFTVVNSTTITAVTPSSLTAGVITVTTAGGSATSGAYTIVSNPTIAVTPTTGSYCTPGGTAVSLTASNGTTYSWLPTAGLSATSGANVNATPSSSTTYTVTGTDGNGCTGTSTAVISVGENFVASATATPSTICASSTSQLNVTSATTSAYTVSSSSLTPVSTSGLTPGSFTTVPTGDDAISNAVPIGFTFNFYGVSYSTLVISTNGNIQFGNPPTSASWTPQAIPNSTAPTSGGNTGINNYVALAWRDWTTVTAGEINYYTIGTAPNRTCIIDFNDAGNYVGQILLRETSNVIDIISTNIPTNTSVQGIENLGGTAGVASTGRNNVSWTSTSPSSFTFTPSGGSFTYSWTPSASLTPSSSVANPITPSLSTTQVYNVTVTDASGCSASATTTVTISAGAAITTDPTSTTTCTNSTASFTVAATGPGLTYQWYVDDGNGPVAITAGAPYSGETSATLTITNPPVSLNGYNYSAEVSSTCGAAVNSQTATLTVNTPNTVSTTPSSGLICNPGGSAVSITASGASTYTWAPATGLSATTGASVTANPTSSSTYTVTGTDGNGCTATSTVAISVALNPQNVTATATPNSVCSGGVSNLTSTGSISNTLNLGTATTSLSTTGSPYRSGSGSPVRTQLLYTASELSAAGLVAGAITGLGFTGAGTPSGTVSNFEIRLGHTSVSALTTTFETSATTAVFSQASLSPASGVNMHTFNAGTFSWDGTSNLLVQVCLTNNISGTAGCSTFVASNQNLQFTGASACTNSTGTMSASKPIIRFIQDIPVTYAWTLSGDVVSPSSQNTATNAISSPTSYTVTATNAGCSVTASTTVTLSSGAAITTDPSSTTTCTNSNATFNVVATGPGTLTYQWYVDDGTGPVAIPAGAPYSGETSATLTITNPSASLNSYTYYAEVLAACGSAVASQSATLTVNTPSTVITTPSSGLICNPGGTAVSVTASGASTYAWAPATGLSATTGASVTANPASSTTYTVTGTDGNGCTATSTVAITTAQAITSLNTTGSSSSVCEGSAITLASAGVLAGYQMNTGGTEPFYDINPTGTSVGTNTDDSEHNISMPAFTFNGVSYTTARVGNNGAIVLGSTAGEVTFSNVALPSTANSAGNVFLAPFWDDLDVNLAGTIKTEVVGSKFIIQYTGLDHNSFTTGAITFQVQLDNSTGEIHFIYDDVTFGSATYDGGASATIGIQYSSTSALQYSLNTTSLTTGQCITFTPNTLTYAWSGPNSYTAATQNASVNPSVAASAGTYTVTATSGAGCTLTSTAAVTTTISADIALSTSSNASSNVGTDNMTRNHLNGLSLMYSNTSCSPIAAIADAAGGNVLGSTQASVEVLSAVPSSTTTSYYYSSRYYTITPTSNGPATITLYYTQDDFSDYNIGNSYQVDMPTTGSNSDPNIGNIKVARVIGDLSTGTITTFTTPTVNWDATNSRWEVTISPSEVGGKYYLYTQFNCPLVISYPTLQASGIGAQSATVSWGAVTGAQDYRIRWRQQGTTNWSVNTNSTTSKSFTTLLPNTTYEVQIRVRCSNLEQGEYSNTMTFTTLPNPCLPPTGLAASNVTSSSADVTWNSVGNAISYFVQLRVVGNAWGGGSTVTGLSKAFTGLVPGTNYEARVYTNCSGTPSSAYTTSVFFTTTALSCTAPTGLAVGSITNTSAVASWNTVAAGSSYFVQLRKVGDNWAGGSTVTTLTKNYTGLIPGTNYEARVATNCGGVVSAVSGSVFFSTTGTVCATPTGLNTTGLTATGVTLNWTSTGATSYSTRVRVAGTSWGGNSGSATNSKVITGLIPNTNYEYQIIGICGSLASAWSAIGTFTTGASMLPILFEEESTKAGFVVYPNPTRDQITIEFSTEALQTTKVKVLDMTGRVVKTVEAVPQAGEHQYTLSLSELSAGMYTVQVYTDDKLSYVTKVQKQD